MDTYSAVPAFQRLPIRILDQTKLDDWMNSPIEKNEPAPTIVKIFVAYEKGPGTPVPVAIEVDKIETEYEQNLPTDEDREKMSIYEYSDKWRRVSMLLRRNLLLAVVRDLDADDANNLAANDEGPGYEILVRLGWLRNREELRQVEEEEIDEEENKTEGEVVAVGETGS